MTQEIELKLSLDPGHIECFKQLSLLAGAACSSPVCRHLGNTYFDTPDERLNRHAVALRVRERDGQYIQTLKTRGESRGGLHQRSEWEWPLQAPHLDLALLPAEALPAGLALDQLRPTFRTDFQRTCWMVDWQGASIELVLDQGQASCEGAHQPISEIELELKSGPAGALFGLALQLALEVPLHLCDVSKAERGYRLQHPQLGAEPPALAATDASVTTQVRQALAVWAWALDRYQFEGREAPLQTGLAALTHVLGVAGSGDIFAALGRAAVDDLARWCDRLRAALEASTAGLEGETCDALLAESRAASCLLAIAAWLNRQH